MEIILKILKIQVTFKYKNKFSKHQVLSFYGQSFLKCICEPPDLQNFLYLAIQVRLMLRKLTLKSAKFYTPQKMKILTVSPSSKLCATDTHDRKCFMYHMAQSSLKEK